MLIFFVAPMLSCRRRGSVTRSSVDDPAGWLAVLVEPLKHMCCRR